MPVDGRPFAGDQTGPHVQDRRPEAGQVLPQEVPPVQERGRRVPGLHLRLDQTQAGRSGQGGRGAGRSEKQLRQCRSDHQLRTPGQQSAQTFFERRLRGHLVRALSRRTQGPSAEGATEDVLKL